MAIMTLACILTHYLPSFRKRRRRKIMVQYIDIYIFIWLFWSWYNLALN